LSCQLRIDDGRCGQIVVHLRRYIVRDVNAVPARLVQESLFCLTAMPLILGFGGVTVANVRLMALRLTLVLPRGALVCRRRRWKERLARDQCRGLVTLLRQRRVGSAIARPT
jgi:hypothetical protein